MATAAALTTTAFVLVTQLVGISAIMSSWYAGYDGTLSEQVVGMVATVPGGFLAGVVVWRVPRLREWGGVPAGLAAMVLMYPASALLDIVVVLPLQQLVVESTVSLSAYLLQLIWASIWAVFLGYGAFTTTFWLTLPLGACTRWVPPRVRSNGVHCVALAQLLDVRSWDGCPILSDHSVYDRSEIHLQ